jgi:uncharacterized membrane protein
VTSAAVAACILCQLLLVAGQLVLKRTMKAPPIRYGLLICGIVLLTGWFFIWLELLAKWDLSRLFPFEGLNPALVVIGASIFLKERLPSAAWIGILLISAGVALVSVS